MTKIPVPKFYSVEQLAKRWNCEPKDVLNYGITGQLKLSVMSEGWWIEYGVIEEDDNGWFRIPDLEKQHPYGQLLKLSLRSTRDLIKNRSISDPSFVCEERKYADISSYRHPEGVIVKLEDILIDPDDVLTFEKLGENEPIESEHRATVSKEAAEKAVEKIAPKKLPLTSEEKKEALYSAAIPIMDAFKKKYGRFPKKAETAQALSKLPDFSWQDVYIERQLSQSELKTRYNLWCQQKKTTE